MSSGSVAHGRTPADPHCASMVLRQSLGIHVRCLYTIQHWGYVLHMYGMLRREWDAQVLSGKRGSVRLIAVVNKSNSKSTTTFLNVYRPDGQV